MPVSLLGLLVTAIFYAIIIIVGICAQPCALLPQPPHQDDENEKEKLGLSSRDQKSKLELIELMESFDSSLKRRSSGTAVMQQESSNSIVDDSDVDHHPKCPRHIHQPAIAATVNNSSLDGEEQQADRTVELSTDTVETDNRRPPNNNKTSSNNNNLFSQYFLANREMSVLVSTFSIIAIRTGGVYNEVICEETFYRGIVWCQIPLAAFFSLLIGGRMFGSELERQDHVTVVDLFQNVYGTKIGMIFGFPIIIADIMHTVIVLSSIGNLLETCLGIERVYGVVMPVCCILMYVTFGGYYAVSLTCLVQFIQQSFAMWVSVPIILSKVDVKGVGESMPWWVGTIDGQQSGLFMDQLALLTLGAIPAQTYFQRVFSTRKKRSVTMMTYVGSVVGLICAIPPVLMGIAASANAWNNGTVLYRGEGIRNIEHFTVATQLSPTMLLLTLGGLSSGLLAVADSTSFGIITILTQNLYRNCLRPTAPDWELVYIARTALLILSVLTLILASSFSNILSLWILPYDILYTLIFPQLFCAVYYRYANRVGGLIGAFSGLMLRLLFGEPLISLPATLPLPFWNERDGQLFPYRTMAMLTNLILTIVASSIAHWFSVRLPSPVRFLRGEGRSLQHQPLRDQHLHASSSSTSNLHHSVSSPSIPTITSSAHHPQKKRPFRLSVIDTINVAL